MSTRNIDNNSNSLVVVLDFSAAPDRIVNYAKINMQRAATELYGGFFSQLQPRQHNAGKATMLDSFESDVQNLKLENIQSYSELSSRVQKLLGSYHLRGVDPSFGVLDEVESIVNATYDNVTVDGMYSFFSF